MAADEDHGLVPGQIAAARCLPGEDYFEAVYESPAVTYAGCAMRRAGRTVSGPRPSNSPSTVNITNQIRNIVDYVGRYFYFEAFRQVVADGEATTHPSGHHLVLRAQPARAARMPRRPRHPLSGALAADC